MIYSSDKSKILHIYFVSVYQPSFSVAWFAHNDHLYLHISTSDALPSVDARPAAIPIPKYLKLFVTCNQSWECRVKFGISVLPAVLSGTEISNTISVPIPIRDG